MKKNTLRLLCLALLVALLLPTLTACNSSNPTTSTPPASESQPVSEAPASQEPSQPAEPGDSTEPSQSAEPSDMPPAETVPEANAAAVQLPLSEERLDYSFWTGIDPRVLDIVDVDNYTEAFAVFGEIGDKTNVYLNITGVPAFVEKEQFNLMIVSGEYCDVIFGVNGLYTTKTTGALEDEIIIDVRDLLEEYAPNYWNTIMASNELKLNSFTADGQIGAILQIYKEAGTENPGNALRKDWLDEFGMEVPTTVDGLYQYLKAAKEQHDAVMYLRVAQDTGAMEFGALAYAYGGANQGNYYLANNELVFGPTQQNYYEFIETLSQWYSEGLIREDYYQRDLAESQQDFGKGTLSTVVVNSAAGISELYNWALDGRDSMNIAGFGNLTIPGKDVDTVSRANTLIKQGSIWSISRDCEDPIPLMKLINYLYTDEGSLICNYGVQGLTFDLNAQGEPEWTDFVLNNPDGLTSTQAMIVYASGNLPYVHDMRRTFYDFDEEQWTAMELYIGDDVDKNSVPLELTQYLDSVESERFSLLTTDIQSYMTECTTAWICGTKPLDKAAFDDFIKTLNNNLNLGELTQLTQTGYERYLEQLAAIS